MKRTEAGSSDERPCAGNCKCVQNVYRVAAVVRGRVQRVGSEEMTWAYTLHDFQVAGAPGWVTSDRFDVSFTPDRTEISPRPGIRMSEFDAWSDRNRQRMQAVRRDRFGLVLRTEPQAPSNKNAIANSGPTIFTALSEQLGLRLVPRKGAVPAYIVEKIEKPGEN